MSLLRTEDDHSLRYALREGVTPLRSRGLRAGVSLFRSEALFLRYFHYLRMSFQTFTDEK